MLKDIRSGDKAKDILKGQNPVQIFSVKGKDRTTLEGKTFSVKKTLWCTQFFGYTGGHRYRKYIVLTAIQFQFYLNLVEVSWILSHISDISCLQVIFPYKLLQLSIFRAGWPHISNSNSKIDNSMESRF
jgi:hypothetical protein